MNLNEVVGKVIESGRSFMVPQFTTKAIGKARVPAHLGPHGPVLTLDVARRDVLGVWVAGDAPLLNSVRPSAS